MTRQSRIEALKHAAAERILILDGEGEDPGDADDPAWTGGESADDGTRAYVEPDPLYSPWYGGYGYWRPYWRYYGGPYGWRTWDPYWGDPFWGSRMDIRTIERFEATAEIVMEKGPKPQGDPKAFDAHAVIENLKPRVQYPEPKA